MPIDLKASVWSNTLVTTYRVHDVGYQAYSASALTWRLYTPATPLTGPHFSNDDVRSSLESTARQEIDLWPSVQACGSG